MAPKIALAMICKLSPDELEFLDECLSSVAEYVDAIYIDFNGSTEQDLSPALPLIKQYDIQATYQIWEKNFVKARNDVFKRVSKDYDWILWLDADDTVENPEKIREIAAITSPRVDGLLADYNYSHDDYGNVTTSHMVVRLARNNGSFVWKSSFDDGGESVHESLVQTHGVHKLGTKDFTVIHHADADRAKTSLFRNIELLEKMHDRLAEKKTPDPRILYYLGVHYFDAQRTQEARQMLVDYLQVSGWPEERSEAWVYIGLMYRAELNPGAAENSFIQATKEEPDNPDSYVELGELCMSEDRNETAEKWLRKALECPKATTTMVLHPQESTFRVYKLLAKLYSHMDGSKLKEARKNIQKALKLRPYDPDCQDLRDLIDQLIEVRNQTRAIANVGRLLKKEGDDKVETFLEMLPTELQDNPLLMQMHQDVMKPQKWQNKSIAIYVGESTLGTWGPNNLKTGIGGSEEAVIQLSRQMALSGWKVTIYGTPGEQNGYDNPDEIAMEYPPQWKHYWEFNAKDEFDVLISWRNPMMFDYDLKARKKYLWIHDVIEKEEFTEYRLNNLTKVMFVSQYHADLYKDVIPKKKIFVTGNGIDPQAFEAMDSKFKRTSHRMIYMSAHERGLEVLYDIWPEVKKVVPDASLDVYYGWKSYDAITKDNPPMQQWKHDMIAKEKKLKGVTNHGRIGHEKIIEEIFKADIFAYPCTFPEVFCTTALKAMAGGAYPVTSDFAVLKDYDEWCIQVHLEKGQYEEFKKEYAKTLIAKLKGNHTTRDLMMKEVRNKFSWQKTAESWDREMR